MATLKYEAAATERLKAIDRWPDVVSQSAVATGLLKLMRSERVLDTGSGSGFLCAEMAAAVGQHKAGGAASPSLISIPLAEPDAASRKLGRLWRRQPGQRPIDRGLRLMKQETT